MFMRSIIFIKLVLFKSVFNRFKVDEFIVFNTEFPFEILKTNPSL